MPGKPQIERKLAAIMFTDIAGYTAFSAKDSAKASELLKTQRDTLKPIVEKHGGSWMKEMGDGLLLTFDSATSAVECSIAIQVATKDIEDLNLRIGIHEGEVIMQDGDVIGDDVNVASRIEPFSAVGGVAISDKVYRAISSNTEFETKYIGKPKLKGVSQEVKVYCITSHGLPETDMSKVSAKLEEESKFNIFALTGGILTAIGVAFWIAVGVFDVSFGGKAEVPSIAILPLDNKGNKSDEFYAFGITSDLISDISSSGLIRVAGLKDIEKLDYNNLSYAELADELFVRYIGQGTIWKQDSIFQLSMELYDTKTNKVTWSERWQQDWIELSIIKVNLASKLMEKLNVSTKFEKYPNEDVASNEINEELNNTKEEFQNLREQGITHVHGNIPLTIAEAYEYYLKAKYIYEKRENTDDTEIAQGLLNKAIELDDSLISARLLLGQSYKEIGDHDKAMEIFSSALTKSEELGDNLWIGRSLRKIGNVYFVKDNNDMASDYWERSLEIAEELGDRRGMRHSLYNIGLLYNNKGDYDTALGYLERSLEIEEELGDKQEMGGNLSMIGNVHANKGDYDNALDYFERSLAIAEKIGDKRGIGYSLEGIGFMHLEKGDYDNALDYFERSLVIFEKIGDKQMMGYSLLRIGLIYSNKGDYGKALDYYERSLAIQEESGDKYGMGLSLNNIGVVHYYKGDYDKALDYFARSLAIQEELGDKLGIGNSLNSIGIMHRVKGDYKKAEVYLEKSLSIQKEIGLGADDLLETTTYLYLTYKQLGKEYDEKEIHSLIKEAENIEFELNLRLYELLENKSYLESAYKQVEEKADNLEPDIKAKFLSYPIPKAIVEEWEKVK